MLLGEAIRENRLKPILVVRLGEKKTAHKSIFEKSPEQEAREDEILSVFPPKPREIRVMKMVDYPVYDHHHRLSMYLRSE